MICITGFSMITALEMIFGQLPDNNQQPPAETPPSEQPPMTPNQQIPPNTQPSDEKMTVDASYIKSLRNEAEKNRKALAEFKAQQEQAENDRKKAEMSEIDRLKAEKKEADDRFIQSEKMRKQEIAKAKLVNIASSFDIPMPMFVVNQIPTDKLSEDLTDEDLRNMVANVITEAETAGMPLKRNRKADTPPPIAPSPGVGATNPPSNYPPPKFTSEQQIANLQKNYTDAARAGDIPSQGRILKQIQEMQKKMGVTVQNEK
jgi:hypothetical protein